MHNMQCDVKILNICDKKHSRLMGEFFLDPKM